MLNGKRDKQTAPHQEGHCHVGSAAAVLLQHHAPATGSGLHTGCLAVATMITQCAGGSPLPPLDLTLVASKNHHARGPCHARHSTPRQGFVFFIAVEVVSNVAPRPCPHQSRATVADRPHLLASPAHITSAAMPRSRRSHLRRLPTMYRTGKPSQAEQPAAIRCKPNCPIMPMPQASSFDVFPRRTNGCQATPAAAVRCKLPQPTTMQQPPAATIAANGTHKSSGTPVQLARGRKANSVRSC